MRCVPLCLSPSGKLLASKISLVTWTADWPLYEALVSSDGQNESPCKTWRRLL
jgi:hypothetical protein